MKILVGENTTIYKALEILQSTGEKCLIVINNKNFFLGTLTDGDIRRAILKKRSTKDTIKDIYSKKSFFLISNKFSRENAYNYLVQKHLPLIPILDNKKQVIDYISNKNINYKLSTKKVNSEVIIMAGGEGTRLRPLTNVLPKPLIPLNKKTVIENIIDQFRVFKINKFIISINYKSDLIKSFFKELQPEYKFEFIQEKKPLGTAGSLAFIDQRKEKNFIITNCDTLIDFDCYDFYNYHLKNNNDITILVSSKEFKVPYGVCRINKQGNLVDIIEKPSDHHLINTGIYIVNSKVFGLIKKNQHMDFNELILIAKKNKKKISIFPVSEYSWFDTGQWDEYIKTKKKYD